MTGLALLVPDVDDDGVREALVHAEERLLIPIAQDDEDNTAEPWRLPEPLADDQALEALTRIAAAIADASHQHRGGRLLAPDGRYELMPLWPVTIDSADLAALQAATDQLARAARPRLQPEDRDTLGDLAEILNWFPDDDEVHDVVQDLTRAVAVLSLAPDADTAALAERIAAVPAGTDVVLDQTSADAYARYANRVTAAWAAGDFHTAAMTRFEMRGLG